MTYDFSSREAAPITLRAPCFGCDADTTPDGLCDTCIARMAEYGEHHPHCLCDGCRWHTDTLGGLRAAGLR